MDSRRIMVRVCIIIIFPCISEACAKSSNNGQNEYEGTEGLNTISAHSRLMTTGVYE